MCKKLQHNCHFSLTKICFHFHALEIYELGTTRVANVNDAINAWAM
jgi:hypothetical protein